MMKKAVQKLVMVTMTLGVSLNAWGVGTPADTLIDSTVTLDYFVAGSPKAPLTATAPLRVAELLDVTVTSLDAGTVAVASPSTDNLLSFTLTNTGNGIDSYLLTADLAQVTDDYDPTNGEIWLENGLAAGLQTTGPNADTLYNSGVNDPTLDANGVDSIDVYVLSDTPSALLNGNTGDVSLLAQSTEPGAAGGTPGAGLAGTSDGGFAQVVVGTSQAQSSVTGSYEVVGINVSIDKSLDAVSDPTGGTQVLAGSTLTYLIDVNVSGGTVNSLVITDPIPANTTYVPNSMILDGSGLSDASDTDEGDFNVTNANTITVDLGDVTGPAAFQIYFQVIID